MIQFTIIRILNNLREGESTKDHFKWKMVALYTLHRSLNQFFEAKTFASITNCAFVISTIGEIGFSGFRCSRSALHDNKKLSLCV